MADSTPQVGANFRGTTIKAQGLRLSDVEGRDTTDYAEIIVGDGAPSGAYGRHSGATLLYFRKDASTVATAVYVTVNGGTAWTAMNPASLTALDLGAVGASTAAAGTVTGDATALPAGTSPVYPTTAADDTKGVIVTASDKVTGRQIFIGNGVSTAILKVYPPTGGTINGAAADAAFSSVSGKGVILYCLNSGANTWLAW